jgi:predicted homoserine dehydrogenase-like protein
MVVTVIRIAVHQEASIGPRKRVAGVVSIAKKDLETGISLIK